MKIEINECHIALLVKLKQKQTEVNWNDRNTLQNYVIFSGSYDDEAIYRHNI